jgi:hypothetical protein
VEQGAHDQREAGGVDAGRRVFVYRLGRVAPPAVILALALGFCVICVLLLFAGTAPRGFAAGMFFSLIVAWLAASMFLSYRPVAFTEESIQLLMGARPWRTIDWRDVDRIEKRIQAEETDGEGGTIPRLEAITFRSGRRRIAVYSKILEVEALKQLVTEKAQRRGIALVIAEPQPLWHAPLLTPLDEL